MLVHHGSMVQTLFEITKVLGSICFMSQPKALSCPQPLGLPERYCQKQACRFSLMALTIVVFKNKKVGLAYISATDLTSSQRL
jgi:hypothetical protein